MSSIFCFDEFELDLEREELRRAGTPLKVDGRVLRVLELFVRNPGKLITKAELASFAWNGHAMTNNSLSVAIYRVRRLLKRKRSSEEGLTTVYGRGYRFLCGVKVRDAEVGLAPRRSARRDRAPFVGREDVLARVCEALDEAESCRGSMIVLSGESGIGKTHLAEVLAREVCNGRFAEAWADCRELDATVPLWPIAALLRAVSERSGLAPSGEVSTAACAGDLASRQRVCDAVLRALVLAAAHEPLLLVIDDLQRADGPSLELLHYLLPSLARTRIVLLATLHILDEAAPERDLARLLGHRSCTLIRLEALGEEQVASYLARVCDGADDDTIRAVHRISEGNPFYMVELACQLRRSPQLQADALSIPSTALELARQRAARLSDATRQVLAFAALIGRQFSLPVLRGMLGRSPDELLPHLDAASAQLVIRPVVGCEQAFEFTHGVLRAALYEAFSPSERRSWHARAVQEFEQRRVHDAVSIAELADHAWRALPGGDLRKAVSYCREAASAACRVHAGREAARYLQHAREALDLIPGASARLRRGLLLQQAVSIRVHSTHDFIPLANQALCLAREQGATVELAYAALLLDPYPGFPRLPQSRNALELALERVPSDQPCLRAALLARLAHNAPQAYDAAASEASLAQALELASHSNEPAALSSVLLAELHSYGGPRHTAHATAIAIELERLSNAHASLRPLTAVLLDVHRALTAFQAGELASADRALARSETTCREVACELLWHVRRFRALLRYQRGDRQGRSALLWLHRHARHDAALAGAELFCAYDQTLLFGGEFAADAQRALRPDAEDPPNIWALKVRALTAAGLIDEARSALQLVPAARLQHLPCDREYLGTLGALARAALCLDAPDYVRTLYELLSPYPQYFAVNVSFLCEGPVSHLLGLLAHRLGDAERAGRHLAAGARDRVRAGGPYLRWRTRRGVLSRPAGALSAGTAAHEIEQHSTHALVLGARDHGNPSRAGK